MSHPSPDPSTAAAGDPLAGLKVAVVHEWLEGFYGSEQVVARILELFPQADLHVLADVMPEAARGWLGGRVVRTSLIQGLPFARRRFRLWLPLMPLAVESLDLSGYDLVLSSSHAFAKGVITGPDQLHVAYVHAPMRWAWEYQHEYLRGAGLERGLRGLAARWLLHRLRQWDAESAQRPDVLIANSGFIKARIGKLWRRDAAVLHPPVRQDDLSAAPTRGGHYLAVGRFVPYKRMERIVRAFAQIPDRRLVAIGDGPLRQGLVAPANVTLRDPLPRAALARELAGARALVFAAVEDFGITPVEALASGTPVIALGKGGVLDTVEDGVTGVLFDDPSPAGIARAIARFETLEAGLDRAAMIERARAFTPERFRAGYRRLVEAAWLCGPGSSRPR
jgi:glycosyltransferase involved in cell wall biosynthesis